MDARTVSSLQKRATQIRDCSVCMFMRFFGAEDKSMIGIGLCLLLDVRARIQNKYLLANKYIVVSNSPDPLSNRDMTIALIHSVNL